MMEIEILSKKRWPYMMRMFLGTGIRHELQTDHSMASSRVAFMRDASSLPLRARLPK